jgi:hypothetical protein
MTAIKIPKTPRSAYNPGRPASALLKAHILHLEHALGLPESSPKRKWTEGAAARYIGELTARLTGQPLPAPAATPSKPKPKRQSKSKSKRRR